jgi:hypothetical protein
MAKPVPVSQRLRGCNKYAVRCSVHLYDIANLVGDPRSSKKAGRVEELLELIDRLNINCNNVRYCLSSLGDYLIGEVPAQLCGRCCESWHSLIATIGQDIVLAVLNTLGVQYTIDDADAIEIDTSSPVPPQDRDFKKLCRAIAEAGTEGCVPVTAAELSKADGFLVVELVNALRRTKSVDGARQHMEPPKVPRKSKRFTPPPCPSCGGKSRTTSSQPQVRRFKCRTCSHTWKQGRVV